MSRAPFFPRRPPRRASRREKVFTTGVLVVLALLVVLFFVAGARPGPKGLPEPSTPSGTSALPLRSPGGWPRGEVESYDGTNLFEKIDGKADAYLVYGVQSLAFASYTDPEEPDRFVDVYLYGFAEALDAFGMYRSQRSGDEPGLDAGDEACITGSAVFGRRGRAYVEAVASDARAAGEAKALARTILDAVPGADAPLALPTSLPAEGARILRFERQDALGVDGLDDAFVLVYQDGRRIVVARLPDEGAAS
ncbi:MAG: DUF6599 family protein, partial [Planctomycetota bacterium]